MFQSLIELGASGYCNIQVRSPFDEETASYNNTMVVQPIRLKRKKRSLVECLSALEMPLAAMVGFVQRTAKENHGGCSCFGNVCHLFGANPQDRSVSRGPETFKLA